MITKVNSSASVLTENVVANIDVGGVKNTDILATGLTLTQIVKRLLQSIYYPFLNAPTYSLTSDKAAMLESGTLTDIVLTANFNRGSIVGKLVAGVWNPITVQDYRAGDIIKYIINAVDKLLVNSHTVLAQTISDGDNTYTGSIQHAIGPQPTDNVGAAYDTPLAAHTAPVTLVIQGKRNLFYGDTTVVEPLNYTVRMLPYTLLNPVNGTTFAINIPLHAQKIQFAYPATLEDVSSVKYLEGLNAEVKGVFTKTLVNVAGANGYTAVSYKVYTYIPADVFSASATYNVTI